MKIDDELLSYLEDLSYLTLCDDEKSRISCDLQKIMNSIEKIKDINTDGASECITPFDKVNVFRDDEVQTSFDRELILKNAPCRNEEMFIAPKTVEG